jgi:AcrR family transcriptional regulator
MAAEPQTPPQPSAPPAEDARRKAGRERIEGAAFALLVERGFENVSMMDVARRAKASNETLYRWYGGKAGLARALAERNGAALGAALEEALGQGGDPLGALARFGPALLGVILSDKSVVLDRAAARDATGELARVLEAVWRETVAPPLETLVARAVKAGALQAPSARRATEWHLALLLGDARARRLLGLDPEPTPAEVRARAARAFVDFLRLCGVDPLTSSESPPAAA